MIVKELDVGASLRSIFLPNKLLRRQSHYLIVLSFFSIILLVPVTSTLWTLGGQGKSETQQNMINAALDVISDFPHS